MSEPKPINRGREFAKGFLVSLLAAVFAVVFTLMMASFVPLIGGALLLIAAAVIAFIRDRPFIGIGILTLLLVSPLLVVGSCFAVFAFAA